MDKDRLKGSAKQAKGAIKEVAGKLTGDAKLEADGKADKIEGKVQNAVGGLKDTLKRNRTPASLFFWFGLGILPYSQRQAPFIWRHRWFLNP